MEMSKEDLYDAALKAGLSQESIEKLWKTFEEESQKKKTTSLFARLVDYLGAFIVVFAMSWFLVQGWEHFGGGGIFLIACAYASLFIAGGYFFWHRLELHVPGGLFFTLAVCTTALAIYGLEIYFGLWQVPGANESNLGTYFLHISDHANRLLIYGGVIIAALIALRFIPFAFLSAPLFASLWLMSLDIAPLMFGEMHFDLGDHQRVSFWFGVLMLAVSYAMDGRTKQDYAFWGYLFGLVAFWLGMSLSPERGEWDWFKYFLINLVLMCISILIQRRVFLIFGSAGMFFYFSHLLYEAFKDTLWFPFALSLLGIVVICLGVLYQRNEETMRKALLRLIPQRWRNRLLP